MPERDEFGGVAVDDSSDQADEFGGVPVSDLEEGSLYTPEEGARLQAEAERDAQRVPERVRDTIPDLWQLVNRGLAHSVTPGEVAGAGDVLDTIAQMGAEGVPINKARAELQRRLGEQTNRNPTTAEQVLAGVQNVAGENLTSPLALALPFAPKPLATAAGIGFAGHAATQVPEAAREAGEASVQGNAYEKTRAYGNLGATVALPAGVAIPVGRAMVRPRPARGVPVERFSEPGERVAGPAGEPVPTEAEFPPMEPSTPLTPVDMVEKTFVEGKPVEVLEQNNQKKIALVVPEGQPDAPPQVVKLSDLEMREVPVETKGEPNASSKQEAATVYGDLRAPAGESPGEVSKPEGERGIQPQTDRGVPETAKGENGQVPLTPEQEAVQLKENTIKERIQAGLKPEDVQVIINKPGGEELPDLGYVQVDEIHPEKGNTFSSNPEQLNALGFKMPSGKDLLKLPQGRYRLPEVLDMLEAQKARESLPLSEYKGTPPENGVPIKVKRADGTTYEAWLVAAPGSKKAGTRVTKVKAETGGLTDGVLGKGDKIIEGPKTAEEYAAARGEKPAEVIPKAQEQVTKAAETQGKRTAKAIKEELVTRLKAELKDFERTGENAPTVEIDIPGDGSFTIKKTFNALTAALKAAERLNTASKGSSRPMVSTRRSDQFLQAYTDAQKLYGSDAEAYKRLKSQLDRSEELELEPAQVQLLAKVVNKLKDAITARWKSAQARLKSNEQSVEFFRKNNGEKTKVFKDAQKNLEAARLEEASERAKINEAFGPELGTIFDQPAYSGIGIVPPGLGSITAAAQRTLTALNRTRKAFGTIWRGRANRRFMDQTIDSADNRANILGQQMGNRMRIGTGKVQRNATLAVIEANGNPERLADFLRQALAAGNTDAVDAVRYAQRNWAALQRDALRARRILDWQISSEQNAGISTEYRDAYVPHIYDRDLLMGAGRPFVIAGGSGTGSGFKKGRTFNTIFDAIEQGYTPKSLDVAELVEHRVKVGQKIINRKQWAESLAGLTDPTDGKPLAAPLIRKSRGPGQPSYEVAPEGYRPIEILPGVRIGVHEAYLPLFRALTGESFISGTVPGNLLMQAAGGIKHGLLMFDTFHASRIMQKALSLNPKAFGPQLLNPSTFGKKGLSLLEYSDGDLARAERANLITPEIANWVRTNRADANLLLKSGYNVGRIQEGLYRSMIRDMPFVGTFSKWVFEKMTRGAMMEAGLLELERISAAKPGVPRGTIAMEVARNLNAYFGNLGRQGIFKSKSMQDIARLVALAPNWVESMARTELKGAAQLAKGVTYDPIVHKTLLTGSIGKGVGQGLLAYFVGTQILNYATRGHSTFQNEEEGHKFDAWIPGPKGSHGFFLSPLSVVAELTHDMLRYSRKEPNALAAASKIASNKASPMVRALKVLLTGRDYDDKQLTGVWNRVKAAGFALLPAPMPAQPWVKGSAYPGQQTRQFIGSAGFKVEPAESAAQQIAAKAKAFMETRGKKPVGMELTDEAAYYKLRDLIRKDDEAGAKQMLADLQKVHNAKQIFTAMQNHQRRPFTGSRIEEAAFRRSLSDKEKVVYDRARAEQREEFQKFLKLWRGRGGETNGQTQR